MGGNPEEPTSLAKRLVSASGWIGPPPPSLTNTGPVVVHDRPRARHRSCSVRQHPVGLGVRSARSPEMRPCESPPRGNESRLPLALDRERTGERRSPLSTLARSPLTWTLSRG